MNSLDTTVSAVPTTSVKMADELLPVSRNLHLENVSKSLVIELNEYLEQSKQNGFVVGVSGGVDSALVSTLCAMTGKKVLLVEMPIRQAEDQVKRAQNHMNWLQGKFSNVINERVDLTGVYNLMEQTVLGVNTGLDSYLPLVNTRSRLRMILLYALAGARGFLVAGTGNKVEDYGIGFFTKYGDGGVDISPIGELYKSEVRALAEYLGVSQDIVQAAPTDGLHSNGATDEDQIGATYPELEWAMQQYDAGKRVVEFSGRARVVMEIYTARHEVNAHKMAMPPVMSILEK